MKIRSLTLAAVVTANIAAAQVLSLGPAQALESRPGMGVLKSTDSGQTWQSTEGGSPDGNTYYVGTANGGVWKTTDGGNTTPASPAPTCTVTFSIDGTY